MEISFSSNSVTDDYIATKFGTCHDSPAVVSCAKYCSDHFFSIWMRAKWNFHHIWIVMEKLLVKWAPGSNNQSGTKPNLVVKIMATNFGNRLWHFVHRLPNLVANTSSHFHHLVNTGLAVGSLVKWLPIKVQGVQPWASQNWMNEWIFISQKFSD